MADDFDGNTETLSTADDFDAHTKYRLGDEVHFVMGPDTKALVGRVVAIHMTTDLRISYALAPPDRKPSDPRRDLTKVPERNIRGLTANTPWLIRVRRRCLSLA